VRDDDEGEGEDGARSIAELRPRIDGFTPARQKKFLKWLGRTGCVRDSAAKAGISSTTIDRTRRNFPDFDARCVAAFELALPRLEAIAFKRATVGAPSKVIRKGKVVEVRVKPSDSMLRLLMTGAAPAKYGRTGAPARPRREERDRIRREVSAEMKSRLVATKPELVAAVMKLVRVKRLNMIADGEIAEPEPGWRMVREEELERLGWIPPEGEKELRPPADPGAEG